MPELPEVETVRRGLQPFLEGATIVTVKARRPDLRFPLPEAFARRLTGRRINQLWRRAKYLLADLDSGETLIMHLGMSGSFRVHAIGEAGGASAVAPGRFHHPRSGAQVHDHISFDLAVGKARHEVVYNDPRRFGFMDLAPTERLSQSRHLANLGFEPIGNQMSAEAIAERFAGRIAPIKAALLDQRLIAGLGNIYVCEALWQARISPLRAAGDMVARNRRPKAAAERLALAIRQILEEAIAAGGSSLRDHKLVDGSLGYFQHSFRVYDREGQECARCGGRIGRVVQSGRSTFYCPKCQR